VRPCLDMASPDGKASPTMNAPEARVCPRCGTAAGEHAYCETCGLALREQPELPTRADWESGEKRMDPLARSQRPVGWAGGFRSSWAAWSRNQRQVAVLAAGLLAGLIIAVVVLVSSGGSGDQSMLSRTCLIEPATP